MAWMWMLLGVLAWGGEARLASNGETLTWDGAKLRGVSLDSPHELAVEVDSMQGMLESHLARADITRTQVVEWTAAPPARRAPPEGGAREEYWTVECGERPESGAPSREGGPPDGCAARFMARQAFERLGQGSAGAPPLNVLRLPITPAFSEGEDPIRGFCALHDALSEGVSDTARRDVEEWYVAGLVDPVLALAEETRAALILDWHVVAAEGDILLPYEPYDRCTRAFWEVAGGLYADEPSVIFELFNEPGRGHHLESPDEWNEWDRLTTEQVAALRSVAPDRPILVGGPSWSSPTGFEDLSTPVRERVANVYQTFHIYEDLWKSWRVDAPCPPEDERERPPLGCVDDAPLLGFLGVPVVVTEWGFTHRADRRRAVGIARGLKEKEDRDLHHPEAEGNAHSGVGDEAFLSALDRYGWVAWSWSTLGRNTPGMLFATTEDDAKKWELTTLGEKVKERVGPAPAQQ